MSLLSVLATCAWAQVDGGEVASVDAGVAAPVEVAKPVEVAQPVEPAKPLDLSFLLPMTPALTSLYYDLSAVYSQQGFGFPEGGMTLTGLRFVERNSGLGKLTVYFVTQLFMALGEGVAASSGRYVGSSYGPGYRVDYYRRYSQAELNDMRAARESAGDAMLSSNMSLDLQLYLPVQGRSTASGISVELTPITFEFTNSGQVGLEVGFAYTKLSDVVPGDTRLRSYENLGVPIRFMAGWRFLQLQLQWTPNLLGGFGFNQKEVDKNYQTSLEATGKSINYNNSPLSLTVSLHPLRWLFVRGTGSWNRYQFNLDSLGFMLEAGVRL